MVVGSVDGLTKCKACGVMNVWRWMAKVLCKPKRMSGYCCVMHSSCRALRMVLVCGLLVVRMMPSMLWMLGVLSGVQRQTFLVEMMCMMSFLVMRLARLGGNRHVLFPAGAEGKDDEEAKVAEGVGVLVFFLAKEGVGTNSFD